MPNKTVAFFIPGGAIHDYLAPTGSDNVMVFPVMSNSDESVKIECNFLHNMSQPGVGTDKLHSF